MITIIGDKYICPKCGKYFYVNTGAGAITGIRCPFFCSGGKGKFIQSVRITM
jgi:hypothetical protein